jgi:hypothetical protein
MKVSVKIFSSILILSLITLAGCTKSPTVSDLSMDEAYVGEKYGNILVIGAAEKITFRNLFEGELVRQLENRGVGAVASTLVLPDSDMLTRDIILTAIRKSDIDSVLITSLADRSMKEVYYSINAQDPYVYHSSIRGTFRTGSGPTASYGIDILFLKSNLYDVRTEKLIWSMTSESEFKDTDKSLKSAVKFLVNKLRDDGLI